MNSRVAVVIHFVLVAVVVGMVAVVTATAVTALQGVSECKAQTEMENR